MSRSSPPRPSAARSLPLLALVAAACATLADGAPGLDNAPSSRAGPFRLLVVGELGQNLVAPNVTGITGPDTAQRVRDLSVGDVDGDPATLEVDGYFAANEEGDAPEAPSVKIVVAHALDGRTFGTDRTVALVPSHDWEGGTVGAPCALIDARGERRLYYEGAGGIGVAAGEGTLVSANTPVLTQGDVAWATAPLKSPGVVLLSDDTYRLYFETERSGVSAIGVATSDDGDTFTDSGSPVLTPGAGDADVDGQYVGSPFPVLGTSTEGREILYVYYTAISLAEKQSISMAARFTEAGAEALVKSGAAMYGPPGGVAPREPSVVRFDTFTILFSTQKTARDATDLVVTAGVSPGNIELPAPM